MRYLFSLSPAGGIGTVTISFNLVDDSNSDYLFQNVTCTGGPKKHVFHRQESCEVHQVP